MPGSTSISIARPSSKSSERRLDLALFSPDCETTRPWLSRGEAKSKCRGSTRVPTISRFGIGSDILIWVRLASLIILVLATGCAGLRGRAPAPVAVQNVTPIFIANQDQEQVWERVVDVVHEYFEIARENRLDGIIETKPLVAAGVLEPWHRDSVGLHNRLEGSLQSIRRRGLVNVTPAQGGYFVSVEIFKEQEDVVTSPDKSAGNSTFQENRPLQRDLSLVVGDGAPEGWIALGHDPALEARMLRQIQERLAVTESAAD